MPYNSVPRSLPSSRPAGSRNSSFRTVGSLLPKLTKPVFEKYGFSVTSIITEWTQIVGHDLAGFTRPEKLKWQKKCTQIPPEYEDASDLKNQSGRSNDAILVLRVDGPRAIEVQFQSEQIIERINRFFGYKAITGIRIIQAPLCKNESSRAFPEPLRPGSDVTGLKDIEDKRLRLALARLASGVKRTQNALA